MTNTICEPLKTAQNKTAEVSRSCREWLAARQRTCDRTQKFVDLWITMVGLWAKVACILKRMPVDDAAEMAQGVFGYIDSAKTCEGVVRSIREQGAELECPSAFSSAFERSVEELNDIFEYLEALKEPNTPLRASIVNTVLSESGATHFHEMIDSDNPPRPTRRLPMIPMMHQQQESR